MATSLFRRSWTVLFGMCAAACGLGCNALAGIELGSLRRRRKPAPAAATRRPRGRRKRRRRLARLRRRRSERREHAGRRGHRRRLHGAQLHLRGLELALRGGQPRERHRRRPAVQFRRHARGHPGAGGAHGRAAVAEQQRRALSRVRRAMAADEPQFVVDGVATEPGLPGGPTSRARRRLRPGSRWSSRTRGTTRTRAPTTATSSHTPPRRAPTIRAALHRRSRSPRPSRTSTVRRPCSSSRPTTTSSSRARWSAPAPSCSRAVRRGSADPARRRPSERAIGRATIPRRSSTAATASRDDRRGRPLERRRHPGLQARRQRRERHRNPSVLADNTLLAGAYPSTVDPTKIATFAATLVTVPTAQFSLFAGLVDAANFDQFQSRRFTPARSSACTRCPRASRGAPSVKRSARDRRALPRGDPIRASTSSGSTRAGTCSARQSATTGCTTPGPASRPSRSHPRTSSRTSWRRSSCRGSRSNPTPRAATTCSTSTRFSARPSQTFGDDGEGDNRPGVKVTSSGLAGARRGRRSKRADEASTRRPKPSRRRGEP